MKIALKYLPPSSTVRRSALVTSLTVALAFGFASPLLAATKTPPVVVNSNSSTDTSAAMNARSTQKCMSDLRDFDSQMQKDGYWLGGAGYGYGYGYPMSDYNYDARQPTAMGANKSLAATHYWRARPGYEVRTLLASAHILAQQGQQEACEAVLGATRAVYARYAAELRNGGTPLADGARWRREQLAAAQPISSNTSYRSDQLIGTGVVSPAGEDLGNVEDLVLDQQTGKIAYLVIGHGGFFGIDKKYVPVPWSDFKTTPGMNLLVLDTTKDVVAGAPSVKEGQFGAHNDFAQQSQKVDAYWKGKFAK